MATVPVLTDGTPAQGSAEVDDAERGHGQPTKL
jgi:hypothetical protein